MYIVIQQEIVTLEKVHSHTMDLVCSIRGSEIFRPISVKLTDIIFQKILGINIEQKNIKRLFKAMLKMSV